MILILQHTIMNSGHAEISPNGFLKLKLIITMAACMGIFIY